MDADAFLLGAEAGHASSAASGVDSLQGNMACDILLALGGASWFSFSQVMGELFDDLVRLCSAASKAASPAAAEEVEETRPAVAAGPAPLALLRFFARLLKEAVSFEVQMHDVDQHPLRRFRQPLFNLFLHATTASSSTADDDQTTLDAAASDDEQAERQRVGLVGLATWLHPHVRHLMDKDQCTAVVSTVAGHIANSASPARLRTQAIKTVEDIVRQQQLREQHQHRGAPQRNVSDDCALLQRHCVEPLLRVVGAAVTAPGSSVAAVEGDGDESVAGADWAVEALALLGSSRVFFPIVAPGLLRLAVKSVSATASRQSLLLRWDAWGSRLLRALQVMVAAQSVEDAQPHRLEWLTISVDCGEGESSQQPTTLAGMLLDAFADDFSAVADGARAALLPHAHSMSKIVESCSMILRQAGVPAAAKSGASTVASNQRRVIAQAVGWFLNGSQSRGLPPLQSTTHTSPVPQRALLHMVLILVSSSDLEGLPASEIDGDESCTVAARVLRTLKDMISLRLTAESESDSNCTLETALRQAQGVDSALQILRVSEAAFAEFLEPLVVAFAEIVNRVHTLKSDEAVLVESFAKQLGLLARGESVTEGAQANETDDAGSQVKRARHEQLVKHRRRRRSTARCQATLTLAWLTKALAARGHPTASPLTDTLCQLLVLQPALSDFDGVEASVVRRAAARGFDIVLSDRPLVLNRKRGARVSLFFRQRFFAHCFPVVERFLLRSNGDGVEKPYKNGAAGPAAGIAAQLAVATLVQHLPIELLLRDYKDKAFPILVRAVQEGSRSHAGGSGSPSREGSDSDNLDLLGKVAGIVHGVINSGNMALVQAIFPDLAPALVRVAIHGPTVHSRITALDCLVSFGKVPAASDDAQVRRIVLRGVRPALDDPVRVVRRFAALCSNTWAALS
eukprot:INCI6975.1.p1 GENE.INCI6975.1~~INCI6975.1.p1  ORF type:complete len:1033 (+),score=215.92 INCI6975.1:363-3101(+)